MGSGGGLMRDSTKKACYRPVFDHILLDHTLQVERVRSGEGLSGGPSAEECHTRGRQLLGITFITTLVDFLENHSSICPSPMDRSLRAHPRTTKDTIPGCYQVFFTGILRNRDLALEKQVLVLIALDVCLSYRWGIQAWREIGHG